MNTAAAVKEELKAELTGLLYVFTRIIISNRSDKTYLYRKIEIRRVMIKDRECCQISCYTDKQVFQENTDVSMLMDKITEHFPEGLCQLNLFSVDREYSYRVTAKGRLLKNITKRRDTIRPAIEKAVAHNRTKNYILGENTIIPPLVDMGIFTKEGRVVKSMYDKYKQINRFVEMVDDILKNYKGEEINIIDFGCGKSYLTFILYYYLVELKHKRVNMTGLDLKPEVIEHCNEAARKYGYDGLRFELGDINGYHTDMRVDMVITLHACDTATDYALSNAVKWKAGYILSVPCCQHEVNAQMDAPGLAPMMKYGIIKERLSALATDAVRGELLEYMGYRTQLLEFVDMAHSPKNILIRAVRSEISEDRKKRALQGVKDMCGVMHIKPMLYNLLIGEEDEL